MGDDSATVFQSVGAEGDATGREETLEKRDAGAIAYYKKLGLGRGLDIAKRSPWLEKSSFQVRDFTQADIMETLEGGSLQHYDREVTSDHQQRSEIRGTVKATNAPVTIGVDAEQSRTYSYSRHAVGTKIINRTISFRVGFQDAPRSKFTWPGTKPLDSSAAKLGAEESSNSKSGTKPLDSSVAKLGAEGSSNSKPVTEFEENFSKWLLQRIEFRGCKIRTKEEPSTNKDELAAFLNDKHQDEKIMADIRRDCEEFVFHFGITHYVSAIELGAAEYQVMSEKEFSARVAGKGSSGVDSIVDAAAKASVSYETTWRRKNKTKDQKKIGKITKDSNEERRVIKDEENEAVVGIQIRPISSLVRNYYLEEALRKALIKYTTKEERLAGPFLIACGPESNTLYLYVKKNKLLGVTLNTPGNNKATKFSIFPIEGSHPHEFMIMSTSDKMISPPQATPQPPPATQQPPQAIPQPPPAIPQPPPAIPQPPPAIPQPPPAIPQPPPAIPQPPPAIPQPPPAIPQPPPATPQSSNAEEAEKKDGIPYYLEARCDISGKQGKVLNMRTSIKVNQARLALQKSIVDRDCKVPVDITPWLQGKGSYFIRCARRVRAKDGYLCVKKKVPPPRLPKWMRRQPNDDTDEYEITVVPSTNAHNDDTSFMLFRLLPQGRIPELSDQYIRTDGESSLRRMAHDGESSLTRMAHDGESSLRRMAHDGESSLTRMAHDGESSLTRPAHDGESSLTRLAHDGESSLTRMAHAGESSLTRLASGEGMALQDYRQSS